MNHLNYLKNITLIGTLIVLVLAVVFAFNTGQAAPATVEVIEAPPPTPVVEPDPRPSD